MVLPGGTNAIEYTPWLEQMRGDILWLATRICRNPHTNERFRMQHGIALMAVWTTANTLVNILVPTHMQWFIHGAGYIEDHYDYSDPQYNDTSVRRDESRECVCDHEDAEGIACDFTGTPAEVGVHKYYCHGIGNLAKALAFSNESWLPEAVC